MKHLPGVQTPHQRVAPLAIGLSGFRRAFQSQSEEISRGVAEVGPKYHRSRGQNTAHRRGLVRTVESYCKANHLWRDDKADIAYTAVIEDQEYSSIRPLISAE